MSPSRTEARPEPRPAQPIVWLIGLALWAGVVPWVARAVGLALDVSTNLEIVDHVVPGVIVLACGALVAYELSRPPASDMRVLMALAIATLAGFWITVTHVPLIGDAMDGVASWGAALIHLSAGPPIVVLGLWMVLRAVPAEA